MKKVLFFIFLSIILLSPLTLHAIEWAAELDVLIQLQISKTYYESVYGNRSQSTLDINLRTGDNWHYNENLLIDFSQALKDDLILKLHLLGRHATDKVVTGDLDKRWELLEVYFGITKKDKFAISIGDNFEYYTNYTFSDSFLGIRGWYKFSPQFKMKVLGGRNRDGEEDTFEHIFGGLRLEFTPKAYIRIPAYLVGISYIHTEVSKLYPDTIVTDYCNDVLSLDTNLHFELGSLGNPNIVDNTINIKSELAISWYNPNRAGHEVDTYYGLALRLGLYYEYSDAYYNYLDLSVDYEYVEPQFHAVMGKYSNDIEKIRASLRYKRSEFLKVYSYYFHSRDSLNDNTLKDYRTNINTSYGDITLTPFYYRDVATFLKGLQLAIYYGSTNRQSENDPRSVNEESRNAGLRISNSSKLDSVDMSYSCGYDFEQNDNSVTDVESYTNTLLTSYSCEFNLSNIHWNPYIVYQVGFKKTFNHSTDVDSLEVLSIVRTGLNIRFPYNSNVNRLRLSYTGEFINGQGGTTSHEAKISFIREREKYIYSIGASYRNFDSRPLDTQKRYGENIYSLDFTISF